MPIGAPLVPVRCRRCGRYLLDIERGAAYSIRCRRCRTINIGVASCTVALLHCTGA